MPGDGLLVRDDRECLQRRLGEPGLPRRQHESLDHGGRVGMGVQAPASGHVAQHQPGTAGLEIALQALFFYWFLVITRLTLGTDWAMAVVLLAVNWIPSFFLLIIVDRYIGVLAGS